MGQLNGRDTRTEEAVGKSREGVQTGRRAVKNYDKQGKEGRKEVKDVCVCVCVWSITAFIDIMVTT